MLGSRCYRIFTKNSLSVQWFKFRSFSFNVRGTQKKSWAAKYLENAFHTLCIPDEPLEIGELRNGMKLICESKCSDVTSVGFFLPAGSMHEESEERGASLFMEHLIFRETQCRNQLRIVQELEEIGGKFSAIALRDIFLFWGTIPSYDIEKLMILLGDIINNGIIGDNEIIKERFTILRELQEIEMDGERVVMDYLKNIAYQGTELGQSVYPTTPMIQCLSAEAVSCFRDRLFRPSLMTMICTGGTSFDKIKKYAEKYIAGCESVESSSTFEFCTVQNDILHRYRFSAIDMRYRDDDEKLAHVAVAVETSGFIKPTDHYALAIAKEVIGSWDVTCGGSHHNASYVARCAFNYNLCQVYKSFNISWANAGLWGCYFACDRMQLQDTLSVIQNEWLRLCTAITEKEVERAVNQCKVQELTKLDDSIDRFFDIAVSFSRRGQYQSIAQRVCRYDKITNKVVRDVAMKYIYDRCPAVAAVGPVENLPDYARIRSSMYLLRY